MSDGSLLVHAYIQKFCNYASKFDMQSRATRDKAYAWDSRLKCNRASEYNLRGIKKSGSRARSIFLLLPTFNFLNGRDVRSNDFRSPFSFMGLFALLSGPNKCADDVQ